MISFIPWLTALCLWKLDWRLSWYMHLLGHEGSRKILCLCRDLNVHPSACRPVTSNWDIVAFCKNVNNICSIVRIAYLGMKLTGCVLLAHHITASYSMQYWSQWCELHSSIFSAVLFQVSHISVNLLKTVSTRVLRSAFYICLERKVPELNSHPGDISYCLVVFIYLIIIYLTMLKAVVWMGSRERMKPCSCDCPEHWMCL
jgi:hypothetical protein